MAQANNSKSNTVYKRTSQGGSRPKTSAMNKSQKRGFKHYRGQVNLRDNSMPTRILLNDCKGNFNEVSYPKALPVGILTVLGDGNYAILINQKNGNTYTQRVDHVRYDYSLGKNLFN